MSWRLQVKHKTAYTYAGKVSSSYNEARVTPVSGPNQVVLSSSLEVHPPAHVYRYVDGWGTAVHAFDLHTPHQELVVIGHSVTETSPPLALDRRASIGWDALNDPDFTDQYSDYLGFTKLALVDEEMMAITDDIRGRCTIIDAALETVAAAHDRLKYIPGATGVRTTAVDAWRQQSGVCQDFVHVSLALLRQLNIPARYVSGYVHNRPDAALGEAVRGESHAWIEAWTGEWWAYDPTAFTPVGERHVVVARGRDYTDVAPLKGVFTGTAIKDLDVEVELVRRA